MCETSWWSSDRATYWFLVGQLLKAHGVDVSAAGLGCINVFLVYIYIYIFWYSFRIEFVE